MDQAYLEDRARVARWILNNRDAGLFTAGYLVKQGLFPSTNPETSLELAQKILIDLMDRELIYHSEPYGFPDAFKTFHVTRGWFDVLHPRWIWLSSSARAIGRVLLRIVLPISATISMIAEGAFRVMFCTLAIVLILSVSFFAYQVIQGIIQGILGLF